VCFSRVLAIYSRKTSSQGNLRYDTTESMSIQPGKPNPNNNNASNRLQQAKTKKKNKNNNQKSIVASKPTSNRNPKFNQPTPVFTGTGSYKSKSPNKRPKEKEWWENMIDAAIPLLSKAGTALLSGFGDYEVDTNSILAKETKGANGSEIPLMINSRTANIMRHREFISDVQGQVLNTFTTYSINPGLDTTFPWLFPVANSFTAWRPRGIVFEYVSLSSDYNANSFLGYVVMATQYNSLDPTFTDKKAMENSEYACSCKPSVNMMHPIECSPGQVVLHELYVRPGTVSGDIRFYDLGRFTILTGGQSATGPIGELWCTYEIEFYQPKLVASLGTLLNVDRFAFTSGVASATPLGNVDKSPQTGSTLGCIVTASTQLITFPKDVTSGTYMVVYSILGSSSATITAPSWTAANCTFNSLNFGLTGVASPQNGVTGVTVFTHMTMVNISPVGGAQATLSYGTAGTLPGTAIALLWIFQVPTNITLQREMEILNALSSDMDLPKTEDSDVSDLVIALQKEINIMKKKLDRTNSSSNMLGG